ncbi:sugar ABC transporter permease [Vallitalea pronyensis]|uniref:Sugar ABC transporter permease n=1 Tax=Vallitalea pronyensis TaxID=1348613 RepID=A0A8J8MJU5_9FIRM|nr:sugar ABC transporter permease [Vallitalea pronyensis]QUI22608.1 sugar ABC transporter permease [Vallitalea pronyensis]
MVKVSKKHTIRLLFVLPFLIPLFLFWIIPLCLAFAISFTDWDYLSADIHFVGLYNYVDIFTDSDFMKALINTLVFGLGTIVSTIALGLLFAFIFQKNFKGHRIYQMIIFSPWVTPAVAVSLVWSWIYEPERGFANFILGLFGLQPLEWLHSSDTAMLSIIIFTIWKSIGWTMLFYIGALERVPRSTYEAAEIDGANDISKFIHVTVPLISPTTYFLFIINLISSIQVYDQIQIMTQGGPGGSTTTLLYLYYKKAFQNFQMGSANAVAMVILAIIILLSLLSTYVSKKWVHYE